MKKSRLASRNGDESKLSNLPEDLLNKILCSLSQNESVRTCVLSKSWRRRGITSLTKLELSLSSDFKGNKESLSSALQIFNNDLNLCLNQLCLKIFSYDEHRFHLPSSIEKLHLEACRIDSFLPSSFPRLRKVFLRLVLISNDTAKALLSLCPSIERFELVACSRLTYVNATAANNLKHFYLCQDEGVFESDDVGIEIDGPTLETININKSKKWNFHRHKPFPRLMSVCLEYLELSADSFVFFTTEHMPSLEKLQLHQCYGVDELRLSSPSMKHVSILHLEGLLEASFDTPNIDRFELVAEGSVPSISFAPISSLQWESYINLSACSFSVSKSIFALRKVLEALSESRITLEHFLDRSSTWWSQDTTTTNDHEPLVVLEHLVVLGVSTTTIGGFLSFLFSVCRPRYIYGSDNKGCIVDLWNALDNGIENDCFWNKDLDEVTMETYGGGNANECLPFLGNSLSQCALLDKNKSYRFLLKWNL